MATKCVVVEIDVLTDTISVLDHGTPEQRLAYRDKLRKLIADCKHYDPVAYGQPDAAGNIVESISPDEKITDMKVWAAQYSVALYSAPRKL